MVQSYSQIIISTLKEIGREKMEEQKELQTIGEILPKQPEVLPELEEIDKGQLINQQFVVSEIYFLPSQFGEGKEFTLIKLGLDGKEYKAAFGSVAIVDKFKKIPKEKIPFKATLVQKKSEAGRTYYDLE